jgi:two-component system, sensor histidine kinase and response regulator
VSAHSPAAHVSKPINVQVLLQTLGQWIKPRSVAQPASSAAAAEALSEISTPQPSTPRPGALNIAAGLARCVGNPVLYRRLLRGFREAKGRFGAEAPDALADGRFADLKHRVHDLRGLAATIGADELAERAVALHQALSADDAAAARVAMADTLQALEPVLAEIDLLLASAEDAPITQH